MWAPLTALSRLPLSSSSSISSGGTIRQSVSAHARIAVDALWCDEGALPLRCSVGYEPSVEGQLSVTALGGHFLTRAQRSAFDEKNAKWTHTDPGFRVWNPEISETFFGNF